MTFGGKRAMVHAMVDGTIRQTNLTNESREYLAKREELRLAEMSLCSSANASRNCAASSRRARRFRITNLKKVRGTLTLATHRRAPSASASFSRSPIVRSSSIT